VSDDTPPNTPGVDSGSEGAAAFDDSGDPQDKIIEIGAKLFEWRDYTPIPLIILVLFTAEPNVLSATFGTLLAIFGELFRIYAVSFIGSVSRTRNTNTTGGNLITAGPFGWVRNPLYVGNFFIVIGLAVFAGLIWVMIVTAALFAFQYYCIVKYEEKLLLSRFGAEYEEFMQKVPAWIPKRVPQLEAWDWPVSFSPALKSERRTLAAIFLMLIALILVGN
jgi:protein-S-isoprenylcysteine O-methyltransferase Ste14